MKAYRSTCIAAIVWLLVGGCGSQPNQRAMTTRPVSAISQAPGPAEPRDAPAAIPTAFQVDMYLISFPNGAYGENEEFWKRIDEQCVDPATSDLVFEALKAGSKLVVKGTSTKGNNMVDTYSLSGVTAAMNEISKACA